MKKNFFVITYRLFFSLLALAALIVQLFNGLTRDSFSSLNFFSFFTIESNIFAVLIFCITSISILLKKNDENLGKFRGAATLYMVTTGIVYVLLLSGLEESLQTPIPWVNVVLHYIMPIAVFIDWCVSNPRKLISARDALTWFLFPFLYVIYSLLRGSLLGWYPYPFLDPSVNGYEGVLWVSLYVAIAMLGIAWVIRKIPNLFNIYRKAKIK